MELNDSKPRVSLSSFIFSIMVLPLSVIKAAHHKPILVELKNGETYSGILTGVDGFMNLALHNVICSSRDGTSFFKMIECYIRGNNIKFIRISDENVSVAKDDMTHREAARLGNRGRPRNETRISRGRSSKWL